MIESPRQIFDEVKTMPPIQERLQSLRIVQIETQAVFVLTFETEAIVAYACPPEGFTLNLDISPNSVRNLLRENQDDEEDANDD